MPPLFLPCPQCAALVQYDEDAWRRHSKWHRDSGTCRPGMTVEELLREWRTVRETEYRAGRALDFADDAPTAKLPPITDTVRRRPPPPVVRELSERVELLRALVQELADYDETDQ